MSALSATGALGHEPIHPESFYEGIKRPLDFIGADAGSGDSGPYFLGSNEPMNPRADGSVPTAAPLLTTWRGPGAMPPIAPSTGAVRGKGC